MNEININSLLCDTQVINITDEHENKKQIKFYKMSISKSLSIAERYNSIIIGLKKKLKDGDLEKLLLTDLKYSRLYFTQIIKLCLQIIRPEKFSKKLKAFFSGNWITRKYIMENFDTETATEFIELVLKPILEKKTIAPTKKS